MAHNRLPSRRCKRAPSSTISWAITSTKRSSTRCSPRSAIERCLSERGCLRHARDAMLAEVPNEGPKMSEAGTNTSSIPKPKKSVALSGVAAGNTALCTVGRTGNDLHYRGYDILDFAEGAEFEEIAYLLVHEKLPTPAELANYKRKL